ncbi:MAG: dethiobiotin synthase [Xanthomonadaceae bacterium]|nr:dethiobiotin synthase [Xanthomonadaceae bacterium]
MTSGYFVAGTDTGVGKTHVAVSLVIALRAAGHSVGVMKPVAAGALESSQGPRNEDALALITAAGQPFDYGLVNPYLFDEPVAPHIAAAEAGVEIDIDRIVAAYAGLAGQSDIMIVEGAGGWLVPIGPNRTMADIAAALGLPVLLVVGIRLGCLNHALLTASAIRDSGLELAGWVANCIDPEMRRSDANLAALDERLGAPRVATLPWEPYVTPESNAHRLDLDALHA